MPYANYEDSKARARYRYLIDSKEKLAQARRWKVENPKRYAWLGQRNTSKCRGVEFNLTFEEWRDFWGSDFHLRGRKMGDMCMGRYGDKGAYEVGNIYKCTNRENKGSPRPKPATLP